MDPHRRDPPPPFWRSRHSIAWVVLAAVATWFLWAEHRAHLLGALPYLILLLCPLMHVFMHRGHHGHRHRDGPSHRDADDEGKRP
ncbi:DUF2933 domain-containing protein [Caldimonas tepidiphila]|uniref:DUF2933 domain-containing protein n=1 Tax=Caldimonas tepidiphila TaxID=2315841 RepID=UPI000E5B8DA2|nr:DUF2933 domain-containing protein [Caldimonas tepidiphila]